MLKLLTLNIEGHKHLDRWLPVVSKLEPDVLCLQEVFAVDVPRIERELGLQAVFVPTVMVSQVNRYKIDALGEWGIALLTNLPHSAPNIAQYGGPSAIQDFEIPNDSVRSFLQMGITKDTREYSIATTHFTWSPEGKQTQLQQQDFGRLRAILSKYPELILCGDFNSPRGRPMFAEFAKLLQDQLPGEYTTTIDANLHYAGDLQLVVDTIFSTPNYTCSNVRTISGLSDHMGIWAEVE